MVDQLTSLCSVLADPAWAEHTDLVGLDKFQIQPPPLGVLGECPGGPFGAVFAGHGGPRVSSLVVLLGSPCDCGTVDYNQMPMMLQGLLALNIHCIQILTRVESTYFEL